MRIFVFIVLSYLLISCANVTKKNDYSESQLIGVWSLKFYGKGRYWFSQLAFTLDGRKCVLSYEFDRNGNVSMDYYLNKYEIIDNVLLTTVDFSSSKYLPPGYVIKDRIDYLDENEFEVFMVQPTGEIPEKHQKLKGVDPESICNVVSART